MPGKWYGADWWFVAISSVLVIIFIIIAIIPGLFAPYSPDAQVGPSFLAPGELSTCSGAGGSESPHQSIRFKDLAVSSSQPRPMVSVVQGGNTAGALNDAAQGNR